MIFIGCDYNNKVQLFAFWAKKTEEQIAQKEKIMGKITIDQSHQIISTLLVNTDWEAIDFNGSCLQDKIIRSPKEAGAHFVDFLKNGGRVFHSEPVIISIDRNEPFNPVKFLGDGWGIWKGSADGIGIEGDAEEDSQSLRLDSIDLTKVYFETTLSEGESSVSGEDKLIRLKGKELIRIDANEEEWGQPPLFRKKNG